jgi:protein required for attachment to host cells
MVKAKELWFVVAGKEKARLLHLSTTRQGSLHVTEVADLASTFQTGEHHRPTRLSMPGSAPGVGHEQEEQVLHFARQLSPWLHQVLTVRSIDECALFAPSHLLGALRKAMSKALAPKVREQDVDLVGLTAGELAGHPKVVELLVDRELGAKT